MPPLSNSDHSSIEIKLKTWNSRPTSINHKRQVWNYENADFNTACELIDSVDWDSILTDDIDSSLFLWQQRFMSIMEECIPHTTVTSDRNSSTPWLSKSIIRLIQKRNRLYKQKRKSPSTMRKYKHLRNIVVRRLRQAKKRYFHKLCSSSINPKKFWKLYKSMTRNDSAIPTLQQNNQAASSSIDKANLLNNFFSSCFNHQQPPLTKSDLDKFPVDPDQCPDDLLCHEDDVVQLLSSLDINKASGPDNISARMLKATAHSIAPSVTKLFNICIRNGTLPSMWKCTNVVPIPKGKEVDQVSNYRPISLLSILSKVLETHMVKLIKEHLLTSDHSFVNQWGFQKGKSTTLALLSTVHQWHLYLEDHKEMYATFLDLKKAFDTVPHRLLINKLSDIGLNNFIIRWVRSYLTDRKQVVVLDGSSSARCSVASGVPQGSVLGPLLFLLYINGLEEVPLSAGTKFVLYADDILVYKPICSVDDHHLFQSDLSAISNWLAHNCMSLNAAKCKYMLISRKRSSLASTLPTLFIGSPEATMEKVTCMKYLGVYISSDLSWSIHIDIITSKARRTLGFIYRKFYRNVNSSVLTKLYTTLVRPLLEYCCAVWDPHLQKDIEKLESIQRLACKICTKNWSASYSDQLHFLNLPTTRDRRLFLKLCTMYKILKNTFSFPENIINFRSRFQTHPMSTRHLSANSLHIPHAHTNSFMNSFVLSTSTLWNGLPSVITCLSTFHTFKKYLKTFMFS